MSSLEPWVIASGGNNPVTLLIDSSDAEKAENILSEHKKKNSSQI